MSTKIQDLPVKTLAKVLARLQAQHGQTGFDIYRDARTNKKELLLGYILQNYSNTGILGAISYELERSDTPKKNEAMEAAVSAVVPQAWEVSYEDMNGAHHRNLFVSIQAADKFIKENPSNRYLAKNPMGEKASISQSDVPETDAEILAATLKRMAGKASLDEDAVKRLVQRQFEDENESIRAHYDRLTKQLQAKIDAVSAPTVVHLYKPETQTTENIGLQHKNFAELLKMAQARTRDGHKLNIWLKGPAGSGKTTAAKNIAQALGQPFQFNGAISTEYELMGFKDAHGSYHDTAFRQIFEHGGVYLFDEIDSSLPKAVLAFNAALANGACRFPDRMVERHADCLILAGANTAGNGGTSDYVGRMKQDAAFLDRFVLLDWPLDEKLEIALARNPDWVAKVQRYRRHADARGIRGHIISPRATFYGEALLAAGVSEEFVDAGVLRGALNSEQWEQLCQ